MFKFSDLRSIDLSSLDLSKFDINALRSIDLSKYVPDIELPEFDTDALTAALRDAAYFTVGLGVVAVEQAQVLGRQLVEAISDRFGASKGQVESLLGTFEANLAKIDERVDAVEARVDTAVAKIEDVLPEPAGALLNQARDLTKVARKQVRSLIRTAA